MGDWPQKMSPTVKPEIPNERLYILFVSFINVTQTEQNSMYSLIIYALFKNKFGLYYLY